MEGNVLVSSVLAALLGFLWARLTRTWPRAVFWTGLALLSLWIGIVSWMYRA